MRTINYLPPPLSLSCSCCWFFSYYLNLLGLKFRGGKIDVHAKCFLDGSWFRFLAESPKAARRDLGLCPRCRVWFCLGNQKRAPEPSFRLKPLRTHCLFKGALPHLPGRGASFGKSHVIHKQELSPSFWLIFVPALDQFLIENHKLLTIGQHLQLLLFDNWILSLGQILWYWYNPVVFS